MCSGAKKQENIELPPHLATTSQKLAANRLVREAVKRGDLVRPVRCPKCGAAWKSNGGTLPTHAHHEDYAKPLDVVWLCAPCHLERHREIRRNVLPPRICIVCKSEFRVPDLRSKICGRLPCVWELGRRNSAVSNRRKREHRIAAAWLLIHGRTA